MSLVVFYWWMINAGVTLSRFWLAMVTRWRKFATSGMIVKTSGHSGLHLKPSCDRRLSSAATSGVFTKSLACQKIAGGLPEGASSCGLHVSFSSIVWPSWDNRVDILWVRVAIVFTSCGHRQHRVFTPHDGNTMDTRYLPMVLRWLHDLPRPSHSHRVATVWHFVTLKLNRDGIAMSTKRVKLELFKWCCVLDINLHHVAISLFGETARKKKAVALLILIIRFNCYQLKRFINSKANVYSFCTYGSAILI